MDIARPEVKRRKKTRRYIYGGAGVVGVVLITAALARLKPAAPSVDSARSFPKPSR
jgi:HlyD family secretion protein